MFPIKLFLILSASKRKGGKKDKTKRSLTKKKSTFFCFGSKNRTSFAPISIVSSCSPANRAYYINLHLTLSELHSIFLSNYEEASTGALYILAILQQQHWFPSCVA